MRIGSSCVPSSPRDVIDPSLDSSTPLCNELPSSSSSSEANGGPEVAPEDRALPDIISSIDFGPVDPLGDDFSIIPEFSSFDGGFVGFDERLP